MNNDTQNSIPTPIWSASLALPPAIPPLLAGNLLLVATQDTGSSDHPAVLYALDLRDGSISWSQTFEYGMISGLAVTADGHILVAITSTNMIHGQGALVFLDTTGQERNRWSPGIQRVSAPVVRKGIACFTADAHTLVVVDSATCQEQVRISLETTASLSAPALSGRVAYVPCHSPHVLAVDLDEKSVRPLKVQDASDAWLDKTPVLLGENLFTVLSTGALLALRTGNGSQMWRTNVGPAGRSLSTPTTDGVHLYVGARNGLHALTLADGGEAWFFPTSRRIEAAPVVSGGVVYAACCDHFIYAIDAVTGRELWRYELGRRRIEVTPVLAACDETPCLLAIDRDGTLTAIARPLSAQEHKDAGHWVKAASAYVALGHPARGAQLLEDHGEPINAAQLWQIAGEPERAAQQYEVAGAWRQAADLWATLDQPLKWAEALKAHARVLEETTCSADECAKVWGIAAQAFEAGGNIERATACRQELTRCLELPIITVDVQLDKGLVLDAWSLLRFIIRNQGYGPARSLIIRATGDQFEGQVMATRQIAGLKAGLDRTDVFNIRPREHGDSVPLQVIVEYVDQSGTTRTCKQTIHIAVSRTKAARGAGKVVNVFVSGSGAAVVGDGAVVTGAGGVAVGGDAGGDIAIGQTDGVHGPSSSESVQEPVTTRGGQMIKILFLAANPTDTTQLRLDAEIRAIDQALRQAEFRDHFDIKQHWAVHVGDIQELFLRHQPHIVHFSGHGSPSSEIILEDNAGDSYIVPAKALNDLFSVLKDNIRCVVLNACFSEQQAAAIAQHIDCVVGMSRAIGDDSAISFATAFYRALGYGRNVETAFKLGCLEINLENLDEQDTPQLLTVKADPVKIQFVHKAKN
ncbi:MAG: PQQ-binding-like beta-propeller repeat protein [Chloroflexi bacterium]|nr:PQQ-binding-like beta-propeller repeat protein [Chloroflexota bacterium]